MPTFNKIASEPLFHAYSHHNFTKIASELLFHAYSHLAIKAHSPMSWAHINLLGEYDFSDAKLTDSHGILPLI